jgi:hypothetical protein
MDPHPLAGLFKRPTYEDPIASELSALDCTYEVLLENFGSEIFATLNYCFENYAPNAYVSEYIKSVFAALEEKDDMHESIDDYDSDDLIEKFPLDEHDACYSYGHDANIYDAYGEELAIVPYVENKFFAIASTLDSSLNEKHDCNGVTIDSIIVSCANDMQTHKLGDAMFDDFAMTTTYCNDHDWGDNASYYLDNLFNPHDEYDIDSGFGEVMTLVNDNPTILEERQLFMHVDHDEKILYDSYIVEFEYDPTCNYYERGKYGCINFHDTNLPLVMLRLLLFLSSSLLMLGFACLDKLFTYKMLMHRKHIRLK